MTKTEKTIAGTWYTITCTAAVTVTQEIDGEIATLATLGKSGTTTFRASASTITIQTEGKYHILPSKAPAALVGDNSSGGGTTITGWYEVLRSELDELLGAGNYKLDYQWEGETAVLSCTLSLNASSEQVKDAERLLRRCAPGVVRVAVADVPLGFTRLAYLGTKTHSLFHTGITVSSATGARVMALNEDNDNDNYSALAGVGTFFLVAGIKPSSRLISFAWSSIPGAPSYTALLNGEVIQTSEINSYPSKQQLKYDGGFFTAGLNFRQSGAWNYAEGNRVVSGALPAGGAASESEILLFGRDTTNTIYSWRGRIYEVQISEGTRIVRNFVPAVDTSGVPCMFDSVTRSPLYKTGSGANICGVETQEQLNALLRGLPNLTGQNGKELYLRIYTPIYESAVASGIIEETATAKNWQIAYDPTTITAV